MKSQQSIEYISGQEIDRIHDDLVAVMGGISHTLRPGTADYIAHAAENYIEDPTLCKVASFLLARVAKSHAYYDCNKRTAYFSARYFLMRNGADFNGHSIDDAVNELDKIASDSTMEEAEQTAWGLCKRDIVESPKVENYAQFYRLVMKSIGVASKLSKQ